jgi:hypothetical protein
LRDSASGEFEAAASAEAAASTFGAFFERDFERLAAAAFSSLRAAAAACRRSFCEAGGAWLERGKRVITCCSIAVAKGRISSPSSEKWNPR